ncbi:MAG TPA: class I SAM-dependent DNA methyltransferase [Desulfobulbus sp.]|nr:class I SAM-dependent DNA methyltransferase [Desulfobulbus sp.]
MPLSWNEIRNRAFSFAREWKEETREHAEAKSFWDDFFHVFGISRRRVATFEEHVKKGDGRDGFIDLLWKGTLLIEHKSRGRNLERAHKQAKEYFSGLKDYELPRYILVSDFERFRLYDLDQGGEIIAEFHLSELPDNIKLFAFMAGYTATEVRPEDPVNIKAAEKMGRLHDALKNIGYTGRDLEVYLVRLLFCLFAEDTGIFERNLFRDFIQLHTNEDGSDLAAQLNHLFQVLNTPPDKRLANLAEQLAAFEYVNGKLFADFLPVASFDAAMRNMLLDACDLDWSAISPAIFGSLFQSVMDAKERRSLGAHYTSETNILKLIKPLFLDDLKKEFSRIKKSKSRLVAFHKKLAGLTFLDPACGCGNFLVITYRELRLLELEVLKCLYPGGQGVLDVGMLIRVNVDQFYGIEVEEFPAQIAQVALWLVDHQMNLLVSETFGMYFARLPLTTSATIIHGNALEIPWTSIVPGERLSYILGNPPFIGSKYQSAAQRAEIAEVSGGVKGSGILDYVTGWYFLASRYIEGTAIEVAFVSTNSITQGEQVGVLWKELFARGVTINFAHRTFQWNSEARGKAAVHCVIIGFARHGRKQKKLYVYEDIRSKPHEQNVANINAYLVDGPNVILENRRKPLCSVPKIGIGNQPIDGGYYLFTPEEKEEFLRLEPKAAPYFKQWVGAREFINGIERWCLWLGDCPPTTLKSMPYCLERVKKVREYRLQSKRNSTRKLAETPTRFQVENVPEGNYIVIPATSSKRRRLIPIGFLGPEYMASNKINISGKATLYHFGILASTMHMAWMRYTAGRLKSDYNYSVFIVYNNFPWPETVTDKKKKRVELASQAVLDARSQFPGSTLADLYDPLTMPVELTRAHEQLDRTVDTCYRPQPFPNELGRIQFLFSLYTKYKQSPASKNKHGLRKGEK